MIQFADVVQTQDFSKFVMWGVSLVVTIGLPIVSFMMKRLHEVVDRNRAECVANDVLHTREIADLKHCISEVRLETAARHPTKDEIYQQVHRLETAMEKGFESLHQDNRDVKNTMAKIFDKLDSKADRT